MNYRVTGVFLAGAIAGAALTALVMRRPPAPVSPLPQAVSEPDVRAETVSVSADTRSDEALEDEWRVRLSGKWVSVDGQQSAELDYMVLRFGKMTDWPDLDNRTFYLGKEKRFLTNSGSYGMSAFHDEPDRIWFWKDDDLTHDIHSFTLYREGHPKANSKKPLTDVTPPPKVQRLLDGISSIRRGERKDAVMTRLGLTDDPSVEVIAGERSLGHSDVIFSLGLGDEWMLKLDFSVAGPDVDESMAEIQRFQIIRGSVAEWAEGVGDTEKLIFPYFRSGMLVLSPTEVKPAAPVEKSEGSK